MTYRRFGSRHNLYSFGRRVYNHLDPELQDEFSHINSTLKDRGYYPTHGPGRNDPISRRNAPPTANGAAHTNHTSGTQQDGPMTTTPSGVTPNQGTGPATGQPGQSNLPPWAKPGFNTENNLPYAQGSSNEFAQPTAISSMISSLLGQANSDPMDFWKVWSQDKGDTSLSAAMNNSMGAFGVNTTYNGNTGVVPPGTPNSQVPGAPPAVPPKPPATYNRDTKYKVGDTYTRDGRTYTVKKVSSSGRVLDYTRTRTGTTTGTTGNTTGSGTVNNPTSGMGSLPANPVYNPWSKGEGGDYNRHGPTGQQLVQPTMEAMALANAYFAPQRMELAYELGDMETDMRRLAVNMGRQVDDPILQAKLYKEANRAVRTLDVQQNTFAFQMVEQRRKEETQNAQFYDNLAQNEHKLMLANQQFYDDLELRAKQLQLQDAQFRASMDQQDRQFSSNLDLQNYQLKLSNRQFYDNLDLQRRYYNLQNWQVANAANPYGGAPAPAPTP